jgi:hypothetical protein
VFTLAERIRLIFAAETNQFMNYGWNVYYVCDYGDSRQYDERLF